MNYLSNAFSLQMVQSPCTIHTENVEPRDVPADCVSCIGHSDTAAVVSGILGREVPANRVNIKLAPGDVLYVAQLTGGRLPEGSVTLPEGFALTFLRVTVQESNLVGAVNELKDAVDAAVKAAYHALQFSYDGSDVQPSVDAAEYVQKKLQEVMRLL